MTNEIPDILRLYLNDYIDFDALENRIISLAWDPDERDDQLLIDTILAEIFYIWDNVSNEAPLQRANSRTHRPRSEPLPHHRHQSDRRLRPCPLTLYPICSTSDSLTCPCFIDNNAWAGHTNRLWSRFAVLCLGYASELNAPVCRRPPVCPQRQALQLSYPPPRYQRISFLPSL